SQIQVSLFVISFHIFFFQAEDGIRDRNATGVQTCALPIFEVLEDRVAFPWFSEMPDTDAVQAYTHFISAFCQMSKNAKRVTVTEIGRASCRERVWIEGVVV